MRTTLLIALILVVIGCGKEQRQTESSPPDQTKAPQTAKITSGWKPYQSNAYGFKATFPWGDPTNRPAFGSPPDGVSEMCYLSTERWNKDSISHSFTIVPIRFKAKSSTADRDATTEGVLKTIAIPKEMSRSASRDVTWAGLPAKEFTFEGATLPNGQKPRIRFRQLINEKTGYLGYVRDQSDVTDPEATTFFDGFELLSKVDPKK